MNDDKEKLVDEILTLRDRVRTLEKELEQLKKQPPAKAEKPTFTKACEKKRSLPPHRWGRKPGHPGVTRPKPTRIDHEVSQTLKACPNCQNALGASVAVEEHIQEDIVPAHVEVTRFLRHRYWCSCCQKMIRAPYAPHEVPHGHLGPRTLATMVWLKYHLALPGNKIKDILYDLCGLSVSEGAIAQAMVRLGNYLQIETDQILKAIRESSHKHADETGWKINGALRWLWAFINTEWAFFHIDKSRGGKVPRSFLGVPHQGTVSSDFHKSYDSLQGDKQKCLVHLSRDIHNARMAFPRGEDPPCDFQEPDKKLKRLLRDASRLAERRNTLSPLVFARRMRRIKDRLLDFALATYSHPFWQKMSARIAKHHRHLLTFLDKPEVPPDNNPAERAIRPHVIIRNRSFQNRTDKGALAHSRLTSLLHTLRLQKRDVLSALMAAYPKHRQGFEAPILFPPTTKHPNVLPLTRTLSL